MAQDSAAPRPHGGEAATRSPGDAAEFERFVRRHAAGISGLAFLLTGDSHEADDLAADVLLAAWRQWEDVSSARSPLAYLRRMTSNMAASRIRRRVRWRTLLPALLTEANRSVRGPEGDGVDVRRALAQLPPGRRACVVLRLAFDLPEREVADILQVSVGTVKSQTSKGIRTLRVLLATSDDGIEARLRTSGTASSPLTVRTRSGEEGPA